MNKTFLTLLLCLVPITTSAWEQTMTCDGRTTPCAEGLKPLPTYWPQPCIAFHLNEKGTKQMPFKSVESVAKKSISSWNLPQKSSLHAYYSGKTDETRIGYNPYIGENANIIVFRDDDTWTESRTMMALTTVTHRNSTGVIYDADIEINTSSFQFGIVEQDGKNVADLENTLTHELGHVFGLSHSSDTEATMFPYASTGETNLRTLGSDDIAAISTIYPLKNSVTCKPKYYDFKRPPYEMNEGPTADSGCSISPRVATSASLFGASLLLVMMLVAARRRRFV